MTQITGFNSKGAPSLVGRLATEARFFGTSYLLLLAVPAVLVLLRRGQLPRLLALFYLAGAVALGYAVTLGTLEENELCLLFVPSLLILPVGAVLWLRRWRARSERPAGARRWPPRSPRRSRRWPASTSRRARLTGGPAGRLGG